MAQQNIWKQQYLMNKKAFNRTPSRCANHFILAAVGVVAYNGYTKVLKSQYLNLIITLLLKNLNLPRMQH